MDRDVAETKDGARRSRNRQTSHPTGGRRKPPPCPC
jgi:hypothetical protein